ncbi:hypothetical protein FRACYDRAFT_245171 [Fragilariopsis cylindrus CCMP1102]|uniref:DUF3494 domain-containing protein n=1 Tax=Fragilariopsis cylindrus CCMP1102 TaxID=635003 RepID=A0A1E7EZT2_9STRA|nr:hypothetical protein FRACYDRAFT_245171 [Fragilariopsis cylindrus CCMP1102]|eukprot:OEU11441.1 hypothetical protein FRACYDRAFT_245171 [Fragilariopsis cylindrus CCMP1102]
MPSMASYVVGGKNAKCADGTEVSEDKCYAAAWEVWGPRRLGILEVGIWNHTPCGCFIWKKHEGWFAAHYKNPAAGSCTAGWRGTNIFSHEMCENFAVHARTTVTFGGVTSTIQDGDVGVYPGTSITGSHQFVNGGDIVLNSPAFADHVVDTHASAMEGNYGTSETAMEIEIGGITFLPGTYRSGSAINFAHGTVVTLDGNNEANPEFIFIAGSTLVTAADTFFDLKNGAKAENVVWVLGTAATLGARSHVAGSIMAGTAITFGTNSKLYGCALAQSAVTFESGGSVVLNHYEGNNLIL